MIQESSDGKYPEAKKEKPLDRNRESCKQMGKSCTPKKAGVFVVVVQMHGVLRQEDFGNGV